MEVYAQLFLLLVVAAAGYSAIFYDSWKPTRFIRGVPIRRFVRRFSAKVPVQIVGKLIEAPQVIFLFPEENHCIFRVPSARRFSLRFPFHGEMRISAGVAEGVGRIPAGVLLFHSELLLSGLILAIVPGSFGTDAGVCLGALVLIDALALLTRVVPFFVELTEFAELVGEIDTEVSRRAALLAAAA